MNNRRHLLAATAAAVLLHALAVCCADYLLVVRDRAVVGRRRTAADLPAIVAVVAAFRRGALDWDLPPSAPSADARPLPAAARPMLGEPRLAEVPALTALPAPVREGLPEGVAGGAPAAGVKASPGADGGSADAPPMWAAGGDEVAGTPLPLEVTISPRYPLAARLRGAEGVVTVAVLIGESGQLLAASIARSSGVESLDAAALAAVYKAQFVNPQGYERAAVVTVRFRLTE